MTDEQILEWLSARGNWGLIFPRYHGDMMLWTCILKNRDLETCATLRECVLACVASWEVVA